MPWIDEADGHRRNAIRIGIEKTAVLGGQKFARRQEFLLGQESRHQP
jgi:hypothetical protein